MNLTIPLTLSLCGAFFLLRLTVTSPVLSENTKMDPEVVPIAMASLLLSADPTLGELLPFIEDVDVFRFLL